MRGDTEQLSLGVRRDSQLPDHGVTVVMDLLERALSDAVSVALRIGAFGKSVRRARTPRAPRHHSSHVSRPPPCTIMMRRHLERREVSSGVFQECEAS